MGAIVRLMIATIIEDQQNRKHYEAGKLDLKTFYALSKSIGNQIKAGDIIFKSHVMDAKYGKEKMAAIEAADFKAYVEFNKLLPEEIEDELMFCPIKKKKITRWECLDYSGDKKNFEKCKDCEIGLANKKLIL